MKKSGWGKFAIGAGIGVGLGILFAPKKGSETRQELKEKADELINKAKEIKMSDVQEMLEAKIAELKKEISELDKEKVLKFAQEKSEQVKEKATELVQLAKDEGTPVLRDAAMEVRERALKVAKEVVEKLEQEEPKGKKKKEK